MNIDQIMVCAEAQAKNKKKPRFVYWYTPWQRWVNSEYRPDYGTHWFWFFEPFKEPRKVTIEEVKQAPELYGKTELETQLEAEEEARKARRLNKARRKEEQKHNFKSHANRPQMV